MKPVVVIIGPGINQKGGVSTVTGDIYYSKISDDFDIRVINTYGERKIIEFIKGIFSYLKVLKNSDLIHINMASNGSFFRKFFFIILTPSKKKIIIHSHGGLFIEFYKKQSKLGKKLIRYAFNRADLIITVSDYYLDAIHKELDIDKSKMKTVYNGVTLIKQAKKNNCDIQEIRVLFMGKMSKIRGIDDFIEIAKKMEDVPFLRFTITGSGNKEEILKKVEKLKNIEVIGWISGEQKKKILKDTHIFVNPCLYESFGISMIEAMNYGATIIGYNSGSIPELIKEEINGYVVKEGDIESIIRKIENLISNKKRLQEISINNIKKSKEFSMDIFIEKILNIYKDLLYQK